VCRHQVCARAFIFLGLLSSRLLESPRLLDGLYQDDPLNLHLVGLVHLPCLKFALLVTIRKSVNNEIVKQGEQD